MWKNNLKNAEKYEKHLKIHRNLKTPKNGFKKKKLSSSGPISKNDLSSLYSYLKSKAWFFSEPSNLTSYKPSPNTFVPLHAKEFEKKIIIIEIKILIAYYIIIIWFLIFIV